jgi:D-serine deaminase-like pyridoxal phosphate-dependent protein
MSQPWYALENLADVCTPALAIHVDRFEENLRRIIALAGGVARLRPHVKTHKMAEIVRRHVAAGIDKFKCATIAEAEMVAGAGGRDVLLAYQPVGPNVSRMVELSRTFPQVAWSAIADDEPALRALSAAFASTGRTLDVLLDVDNGMRRTGVPPGPRAAELYALIASLPGLTPGGFHVYDGHIRDLDLNERVSHVEADFAPVNCLRDELASKGLAVPRIVAGGTPTFPVHARQADRECSPGTCAFWDWSYATKFPDLDFLHAAVLVSRVVSCQPPDRLCLDLGYKAVSPDNPNPRAHFPDLPDAEQLLHNEEHLALRTSRAASLIVGDVVYGIPFHVCPTVALHHDVLAVEERRVIGRWQVTARDRRLTI